MRLPLHAQYIPLNGCIFKLQTMQSPLEYLWPYTSGFSINLKVLFLVLSYVLHNSLAMLTLKLHFLFQE
jgi:hypothetical protein